MFLGLDIGSVSIKLVLLDENLKVVRERYIRTRGKPLEVTLEALEQLFAEAPPSEIEAWPLPGPAPACWASCTASGR